MESPKKDPAYWNALRQADIRIVDGIGLKYAGMLHGATPTRVSGVELAEAVLQQAQNRSWNVAMIGGGEGIAERAVWEIRKSYPNLQLVAEHGGVVSRDGVNDEAGEEMKFRLTSEAPDVLLVGFGHPKQERWIVNHLADFPSVKLAIGIGGTLDFWAGKMKRSPRGIQVLGLEWLWRLIQEPKRWKRIWNAVIIFPIVVIQDRVFHRSTK